MAVAVRGVYQMSEDHSDMSDSDKADELYSILSDMGLGESEIRKTNVKMGHEGRSVSGLERQILSNIDFYARHKSETGFDRLDGVFGQIERYDLPDTLAMQAFQSERDSLDNTIGFLPDKLEQHLRLEQEIERYGLEDTIDTRRQLWDEMVSYTTYKVTVKINDEIETQRVLTEKSDTKAHNRVINRIPMEKRKSNEVDVTTEIVERYFPDVDPLKDMEEFVFYY
jgi:hypothetical protein